MLKVLILMRLFLRFMWSQTLARVWYFLLSFFIMCCVKCVYIKIKVLFSFKMNSKQFFSFDNFNLLLWGYYSIGFRLLLALKLTIRIIGTDDVVETKLERGEGMKDFCCLDLKCSFMFCFTSNFHLIDLNLYATLFMA